MSPGNLLKITRADLLDSLYSTRRPADNCVHMLRTINGGAKQAGTVTKKNYIACLIELRFYILYPDPTHRNRLTKKP